MADAIMCLVNEIREDRLNKTNEILCRISEMEKRMAMNNQQLEALLNNQTTQIGKIAKEQSDRFDVLTAEIKKLTDLIDAGGTITPAIETAATAVQTALDALDASIPDAPA